MGLVSNLDRNQLPPGCFTEKTMSVRLISCVTGDTGCASFSALPFFLSSPRCTLGGARALFVFVCISRCNQPLGLIRSRCTLLGPGTQKPLLYFPHPKHSFFAPKKCLCICSTSMEFQWKGLKSTFETNLYKWTESLGSTFPLLWDRNQAQYDLFLPLRFFLVDTFCTKGGKLCGFGLGWFGFVKDNMLPTGRLITAYECASVRSPARPL